ncbi:hypothetical protein [Pseudoalteromonas rubra]|uniref:DUF304 domain-containing protein n=1 Tax=Pseudoalteromonas rubra TaxID=43658 RepID=A0A0F4QMS3_9GAMM|nr:hypothetical protein [Pseudoalteromonas rubra]KJZ07932.1 hypothetical protein TW77_13780 [Pseudoalteromonas rubra]
MIFKKHTPHLATYQKSAIVSFLLKPLGAIILFVGLLNIYFAAGEKSLPFWAIGIIAGIGWHATFGNYRVRVDLAEQMLELKASALMPIFKRRYELAGARGFRVVSSGASTRPYSVVLVTREGLQVAISNSKHQRDAVTTAREFAEFTGLPVIENISS